MKSLITSLRSIGFLTIALTLALVANFAYGQWTNPTVAPTGGAIAVPIHTGGGTQTKAGTIRANQLATSDRMRSDQYCDASGANCFSVCDVPGACPTATPPPPPPPPPPVSTCSGTTIRSSITGTTAGTVWGTNIYTNDSALGKAAVHAGLMTVGQTANIQVTLIGDRTSFTGSTRNGVTSNSYSSSWCAMTLSLASTPTPPPPPPPPPPVATGECWGPINTVVISEGNWIYDNHVAGNCSWSTCGGTRPIGGVCTGSGNHMINASCSGTSCSFNFQNCSSSNACY